MAAVSSSARLREKKEGKGHQAASSESSPSLPTTPSPSTQYTAPSTLYISLPVPFLLLLLLHSQASQPSRGRPGGADWVARHFLGPSALSRLGSGVCHGQTRYTSTRAPCRKIHVHRNGFFNHVSSVRSSAAASAGSSRTGSRSTPPSTAQSLSYLSSSSPFVLGHAPMLMAPSPQATRLMVHLLITPFHAVHHASSTFVFPVLTLGPSPPPRQQLPSCLHRLHH